jgi:hypothetical protein
MKEVLKTTLLLSAAFILGALVLGIPYLYAMVQ